MVETQSVRFALTPAAKSAILDGWRQAEALLPSDPPVFAGLVFGWPSNISGEPRGHDVLMVSYWTASQSVSVDNADFYEASGLKLVLGNAASQARIPGRVVDHDPLHGLFVRDRQPGDPS